MRPSLETVVLLALSSASAFAAPAATLPAVRALAAEVETLKRETQLTPAARRPSLGELRGRLEALRSRLAAPGLPPAEVAALRKELDLLEAALGLPARPVAAPAPRANGNEARGTAREEAGGAPAGAARESVFAPGSLGVLSDALSAAAASSAKAPATFFDGLRARAAAPSGAAVSIADAAGPAAGADEDRPARGPELPPAAAFVSRHVIRERVNGGARYHVGLAELMRSEPGLRPSLARGIAAEALSAAGVQDPSGARAAALETFLRDVPDYAPRDARSARLLIEDANHYRLVFDRGGASRRIILGEFLPLAASGSSGRRLAFTAMQPVEVAGEGAPTGRPGYWRQYSPDGRRFEWSIAKSRESKGWGPWRHEDAIERPVVTEQAWDRSRWTAVDRTAGKARAAEEGKSWLGRAGDRIMKAPVAGKVLKFCDDTAATLYTGIVGGAQILTAQALDSDLYRLEAGGSYSKNPVMNRLVGEQGHLDRLTPGARRDLDAVVLANRAKALERYPLPLPPGFRSRFMAAPIETPEAAAGLRDGFGAGTYGKRMLEKGAETGGPSSWAWYAGGTATGIVENVAEGVLNPILWAMLGAGHAATAIKGAGAAATATTATTGSTAALAAARAAQAAFTAAWWGPWMFTAADNAGRTVELASRARFDRDFFVRAGEAGADTIYLFILP